MRVCVRVCMCVRVCFLVPLCLCMGVSLCMCVYVHVCVCQWACVCPRERERGEKEKEREREGDSLCISLSLTRTGQRTHVSSRQSQEHAATYLKIRRVARPDGVTPRTAHPPSPLHRVLPPVRLFWRPHDHFPNSTSFFEFVLFTIVRCFYPQPTLET